MNIYLFIYAYCLVKDVVNEMQIKEMGKQLFTAAGRHVLKQNKQLNN